MIPKIRKMLKLSKNPLKVLREARKPLIKALHLSTKVLECSY